MTYTERVYYLVLGSYCVCWSFIVPVYPLFLLSRGLDLLEINLVLATFLIGSFLFEVPTGAVADLAGRKVSFILSCVVRMGAFALYAFADGFADCVIAELIDAVGMTLASGALDAWAVDGMRADGHQGSTDRLFARAQLVARPMMVVSGVGGGYLAMRGYEWAWFAGALGFAVTALLAALTMREEVRPNGGWRDVRRSLGRTVRDGFGTVQRAPVLLVLCLISMLAAFGAMPVNMYWQPRMEALTGEGTWLMGWIWALLNLASVVGSALIPRLLGRFEREYVLCAAALWRATMLVLVGVAIGVGPAVVGLLLQEVSLGLSEPLLQAWMNEHIASEQRATVLSVRSMFFTLGGALGLVSIGLVAQRFGIPLAWMSSGLIFVLVAPGYLFLGRLAGRTPPLRALPSASAPLHVP